MTNETLRAHCGGCAGAMVLDQGAEGFRYVCLACEYETPWRVSAELAAKDAVWAPAKGRKGRRGDKGKG